MAVASHDKARSGSLGSGTHQQEQREAVQLASGVFADWPDCLESISRIFERTDGSVAFDFI
jgi:hypothetical protein